MITYDFGTSPDQWMFAKDIASRNIQRLSANDSATETRWWMEACGFDVAFVGDLSPGIVRRSELEKADCDASLEGFVEQVPPESQYPLTMSLDEAIRVLRIRPWFILQGPNSELVGMVTRTDLSKPPVSAFVLGHFITLERVLRRLCASYGYTPMSDEPPEYVGTGDLPSIDDSEGLTFEVRQLPQVVGAAVKIPALRSELDYSRNEFKSMLGRCVELRNRVAHSRGLIYNEHDPAHCIDRFLDVQDLTFRAVRLVQRREQIWEAIGRSEIVDTMRDIWYSGPNASALPGLETHYVINAANPFEECLGDTENRRRNACLREVLQRKAKTIIDVVGRSECQRWAEESFMVSGIVEATVLDLAKRFGQRAVFKLTDKDKLVVSTDGEIRFQTSRFSVSTASASGNGEKTSENCIQVSIYPQPGESRHVVQ